MMRPAGGHWVIWVMVFKLQVGASMRMSLGHLGHCFLCDPNDPKGTDLARWGHWAFGSFGSFCHRVKIGAGSGVAWHT